MHSAPLVLVIKRKFLHLIHYLSCPTILFSASQQQNSLICRGLVNPTCEGGWCIQPNAVNPTCSGGHCVQERATNPSCGGWCNQRYSSNPSCNAGSCDQSNSSNPSCSGGRCIYDRSRTYDQYGHAHPNDISIKASRLLTEEMEPEAKVDATMISSKNGSTVMTVSIATVFTALGVAVASF